MNTDNTYTSYTDFLKDKKFIQWQLMPNENLDIYWQSFIGHHAEHKKNIQKAITYLKKIGLNESDLSENERTVLLEKIQRTIRQEKKIKQRKLFWYTSASAAAIALIIIGITLFYPSSVSIDIPDKELITGELLNNEDIQLITSGEAIIFKNDVEVTLNEEGTAEIVQANNETSKVKIDRDKLNSLVIPYGKRSTLTLADGSRVWLNSGSVLEFPAQFSGKKREIRLASGEMYIEVAHNKEKPFYVQTGDFNVKVYGTKFNISTYSGSPQSVVLVEGSVSLQSKDHKELFITPSEKAVYSGSGTFDTQKVDVNQFISWKDGYLSFDKTPMTEVLQQIGRYYNLSFDFENDINLQKRTCTGKIYLSDNLDNVMTIISLLSSTSYQRTENKILITNELS
ncbi:sigma factor regulatory protein, FecR/PupR family [Proteiniphilum saccharofermentans]|uniref:Sigma factor regulatory protein, FecR/PupR family n=1 Tax=Proteiniphilum saccharofermentans TaxID=1642647 RepID=A0A1R3SWG5_9BACT|nr:FecR family protein [Proteiniphilum saccharofermentans]SCD19300.1 sigma factor regulatory protein, FecR/PupR family [Proteiniphilum saccharofermentans]SEA06757.1 FecR family protein [Porphyromonadaceae bacterium KH3R12]